MRINTFFQRPELDANLYCQKDTYGNHNILPAIEAQKYCSKIMDAIEKIPSSYREFYRHMIVKDILKFYVVLLLSLSGGIF